MSHARQEADMNAPWRYLVDDALQEILRREPEYLSRFPLGFSTVEAQRSRYLRDPVLSDYSQDQIATAMARAVSHCVARGAHICEDVGAMDPVADMLLDSAIAGFGSASDVLSSFRGGDIDLQATLKNNYCERCTAYGSRYFVRRSGSKPVVLINATGAPLSPWSQLIADPSHDFRIVVVESKCSDLLTGGMKSYVDLSFDVDEIGSALNEEGFNDVSVLAWCSGGRTALDFVVKNADRVRSVVLVSPSLCGVKGVSPQLTGFESGLGQVCSTVRKHPAVANFFVKGIDKLVRPADWAKNRNEPVKRAAALFRLPAKDRAGALVASMLDVEFLRNYAKRDQSDSTYPIHEALQRLTLPILLITGDHDNIVNSEYVATVLDVWATDVVHASIRGAGHYAQDLQYSHFLTLANRFLNDQALTSGARVRVKRIGRHARGN